MQQNLCCFVYHFCYPSGSFLLSFLTLSSIPPSIPPSLCPSPSLRLFPSLSISPPLSLPPPLSPSPSFTLSGVHEWAGNIQSECQWKLVQYSVRQYSPTNTKQTWHRFRLQVSYTCTYIIKLYTVYIIGKPSQPT